MYSVIIQNENIMIVVAVVRQYLDEKSLTSNNYCIIIRIIMIIHITLMLNMILFHSHNLSLNALNL